MCCTNLSRYINAKCASFIVAVFFSTAILVVAVMGLLDVYTFPGSSCYATGLLSSILTLWASPPHLEPNKEKKPKEDNQHEIL
jgi:hypothetical protein